MALVGSRPRRNLRDPAYSRDSNTLRASVLDAALELGIGTSRAVENLLFNTVDEEDDDNFTTPTLTSASAATSDESSPSVPPWNVIPPQFVPPAPKPDIVVPPPTLDIQYTRAPSEDSHAPSLRPNQPRKLRKARKDDGYDSDGGYLSDSSKKKKKSKDRKNTGSTSHEADFLSDGGYLSDATKKPSNKKKKDKKGDKVTDGYVTDSKTHHKLTKKSRAHTDDGDLSDGGYLSEVSLKKKKTFFRIGSRSPSTPRKGSASSDFLPPPVPALPPQPLPIAERFARSPVPFDQPDGGLSSAAPSIRAPYSPVPPSVDESVTPLSSIYRRDWSPPPPSDSVRTATRPSSVDLSAENLTSSSTSHENNQFSPVLPPVQSWEAAPFDSPRARSREAESRTLSPGSSHEQLSSASAAPRQHGVRFTPSTRFSPSDGTFPIPPSLEVSVAPERRHLRPKISLPIISIPNSNQSSTPASPLPSILRNAPLTSTPSDSRPFLSPATRSRMTPSPGIPNAPFLRGASPSVSELSFVSSSDFIVPSPRPRFFDELPPPSPPPTGPLPEVPSYGLYSHQIPHIKRGRESPFPARGILPAEEASRLIESTLRARREALLARLANSEAGSPTVEMGHSGDGDDNGNGSGGNEFNAAVDDNDVPDLPWLTEAVPTPLSSLPPEQQREDEQDWPDDESVRPDIAQFYLYAPSGNSNGGGGEDIVAGRRRSPDAPHDERSTYTYSYSASSTGRAARGDVESYYFGVPDTVSDDGADDSTGEAQSRASFVDDERSRDMRARLIARVDALYGAEKVPPVPKLRPF